MFERPYHPNLYKKSDQQDDFEVLRYYTMEIVHSLHTKMGCRLIHPLFRPMHVKLESKIMISYKPNNPANLHTPYQRLYLKC